MDACRGEEAAPIAFGSWQKGACCPEGRRWSDQASLAVATELPGIQAMMPWQGRVTRATRRDCTRSTRAPRNKGWVARSTTQAPSRPAATSRGMTNACVHITAGHSGPDPRPEVDTLLAATALVHGLTLVTRNVDDVAGTGVRVLNPFDAR